MGNVRSVFTFLFLLCLPGSQIKACVYSWMNFSCMRKCNPSIYLKTARDSCITKHRMTKQAPNVCPTNEKENSGPQISVSRTDAGGVTLFIAFRKAVERYFCYRVYCMRCVSALKMIPVLHATIDCSI